MNIPNNIYTAAINEEVKSLRKRVDRMSFIIGLYKAHHSEQYQQGRVCQCETCILADEVMK